MKLLAARFTNFRLLRDLKLDFSSEADRRLTVIRAANESGKTTILHALQWALYGDESLPAKGVGFRLHPIDWDEREGSQVPIEAEVEFELTRIRRFRGQVKEASHRYRLVRTTYEEIDAEARRPTPAVKLYRLANTGAEEIEKPDSFIRDELPLELREVFFTDGDRALSFIEADVSVSTKRQRVQHAIRSLLGLEVIQSAIKHVRKASSEANRKAKGVGSSEDLAQIASRLDSISVERESLEEEKEDAQKQFANLEEAIAGADRQIADALRKGDKEKIQKSLDDVRARSKKLDRQIEAANAEHSQLFKGQALAADLLSPVLAPAFARLEELHDQRKIPSATIPVLQDRLSSDECICGESLAASTPDGARRRKHLQSLVTKSKEADAEQGLLTELYFNAREYAPARGGEKSKAWQSAYKGVFQRRQGLQDLRDKAGKELRDLEAQLDAMPDTNIQGLRSQKREYSEQRDRFLRLVEKCATRLGVLRRDQEVLQGKRDKLLRAQQKGQKLLAELTVAQDLLRVLKSAYDRITTEELAKVSERMNEVFLEMIGADPSQKSVIRNAKISDDFDIVVSGPNGRLLNPDRDLNGASRRALTLAFILALTDVSDVEAPNVIDTPLGMTSGYVKHAILSAAVRESAQLVLFLTHDEIHGCEKIIDEHAGVVFTLTNPAHYPKMLYNDPGTTEQKVLRCECDHRSHCGVCHRRTVTGD